MTVPGAQTRPEAGAFDVKAAIAAFLADAGAASLELPHMTAGERKSAKKLVEEHHGLSCESFGFGAERKLLLLKRNSAKGSDASSPKKAMGGLRAAPRKEPGDGDASYMETQSTVASLTLPHTAAGNAAEHSSRPVPALSSGKVRVKNTFIDDWDMHSSTGAGQALFKSMPSRAPPPCGAFGGFADSGSLSVPSSPLAEEACCSEGEASVKSVTESADYVAPKLPDCTAEVRNACKRATEGADHVAPKLPDCTVEVRNTFIHIEQASADERVVRSMPHGMFGQLLLEEAAAKAADGESSPRQEEEEEMPPVRAVASMPAGLTGPRGPPPATPPRVAAAPAPAGAPVAPPPPPLTVAPGTMVVIQGLSKCLAFNGCCAFVQRFDAEEDRYSVRIIKSDGSQQLAKVRGDNLMPIPSFQPEGGAECPKAFPAGSGTAAR